ncbi:MAG: hypothetical protein L0I76_01775 [Pseudonocardia sp.]|nr:hypothetical protein [Pseudonocardia sp.]
MPSDRLDQQPGRTQDGAGVFGHLDADLGRASTAGGAVEQANRHLVLQLADLFTQGCRRQVEAGRGASEVAVFDHRQEIAEATGIHIHVISGYGVGSGSQCRSHGRKATQSAPSRMSAAAKPTSSCEYRGST